MSNHNYKTCCGKVYERVKKKEIHQTRVNYFTLKIHIPEL